MNALTQLIRDIAPSARHDLAAELRELVRNANAGRLAVWQLEGDTGRHASLSVTGRATRLIEALAEDLGEL